MKLPMTEVPTEWLARLWASSRGACPSCNGYAWKPEDVQHGAGCWFKMILDDYYQQQRQASASAGDPR